MNEILDMKGLQYILKSQTDVRTDKWIQVSKDTFLYLYVCLNQQLNTPGTCNLKRFHLEQ